MSKQSPSICQFPGILAVAALLLFCDFCRGDQPAPAVCNDDQCIQVGSYNIELLGKTRKRFGGVDRGPRTDEQLQRLADRVAVTLDLEVVVFEEINTGSNEWATLRSKLAAHGYRFFEGSSSDREQFVVLAWDADEVTLQDNSAHELDVRAAFDFGDCEEEGLRKPVAGRFKAGEFDFWVIGVHLKSRSGTAQCTAQIRTEQCEDLVEKIDALTESSHEHDVLIVGDFNERRGHASFEPLVDAGFVSQMRFRIAGAAEGSYVKNGDLNESDDLIDHVMLRPENVRELVRNSAFIMPLASRDEAKQYIIEQSDHVPVCVSFRTDEDLDDEDD